MLAPSTTATWVGAIATSLAVIVALFKDEILRSMRMPQLTVRLDPRPPDCILVPTATVFRVLPTGERVTLWSGPIYYLRLWIENHGKSRAEQVQVFVSRLYREDANHEWVSVADFEPMNLRWSNPRDVNNPEIFAPGISRDFGKHCDLLSVSDPANPTDHSEPEYCHYTGRCVGTLQLEVVPSGGRNRLIPGNYVIEIQVGAANARPVTKFVKINLTGGWSANLEVMFREHLGVSIADRLS